MSKIFSLSMVDSSLHLETASKFHSLDSLYFSCKIIVFLKFTSVTSSDLSFLRKQSYLTNLKCISGEFLHFCSCLKTDRLDFRF